MGLGHYMLYAIGSVPVIPYHRSWLVFENILKTKGVGSLFLQFNFSSTLYCSKSILMLLRGGGGVNIQQSLKKSDYNMKANYRFSASLFRYMYWINYGKEGTTLDTAGMDGSNYHVITFVPMEQPVGLTLDLIASRLYWISEYKGVCS